MEESKKMTVARLIEYLQRIPEEDRHATVSASYDGSCESQIYDFDDSKPEIRRVDWNGRPLKVPTICLPGG